MTKISIHAPREGSDTSMCLSMAWAEAFQSTLPVRGATYFPHALYTLLCYFNPRSP